MKINPLALLLLVSVFVSACSTSAKTYYYTLQTVQAGTPIAKAATTRQVIAITTFSIPEIVDRPQLVLRAGETQVLISDNHLWGQALKSEILRNLAAHLASETGAQVTTPGQGSEADIKLSVDILRFDSVPNGEATIEAQWRIQRKDQAKAINGYALVREASNAAGYDAIVAAHSRALTRLSNEIAATLKSGQ